MLDITQEVKAVLNKYPSLSCEKDKDGYILTGTLTMDKSFDKVPLYDDYSVKIFVHKCFPEYIPKVFADKNNFSENFEHFLVDGALCLGAKCDLFSFLDKKPSLLAFIDEILMSYLYAASYFKTYGEMPYGERSHGIEGIREAYKERYEAQSDRLLSYLLCYLTGDMEYRGHAPCPCGSTAHFRKCHGKQLIKDIRSNRIEEYKIDAYVLLIDYIERNKGKKQNETSSSSNAL